MIDQNGMQCKGKCERFEWMQKLASVVGASIQQEPQSRKMATPEQKEWFEGLYGLSLENMLQD